MKILKGQDWSSRACPCCECYPEQAEMQAHTHPHVATAHLREFCGIGVVLAWSACHPEQNETGAQSAQPRICGYCTPLVGFSGRDWCLHGVNAQASESAVEAGPYFACRCAWADPGGGLPPRGPPPGQPAPPGRPAPGLHRLRHDGQHREQHPQARPTSPVIDSIRLDELQSAPVAPPWHAQSPA